jgi:hypothetical protein
LFRDPPGVGPTYVRTKLAEGQILVPTVSDVVTPPFTAPASFLFEYTIDFSVVVLGANTLAYGPGLDIDAHLQGTGVGEQYELSITNNDVVNRTVHFSVWIDKAS